MSQQIITKPYHFDRTGIFQREILPDLEKLVQKCKTLGIPHMLAFQYTSTLVGDDIYAGAALSKQPENQRMDCSPMIIAGNSLINCMRLVCLNTPDRAAIEIVDENPLLLRAIRLRDKFRYENGG